MNGNTYTLQFSGTQVNVHNFQSAQAQWEYVLGENTYIYDLRLWQDLLAFRCEDRYCLMDLTQQKLLWEIPRGSIELLDFAEDGSILWALEYRELIAVDTATGSTARYPIPDELDGLILQLRSDPILKDGKFWYLTSAAQKLMLCGLSPVTGETEYYDLLSAAVDIPPEVEDFAESIWALEEALTIMENSGDANAAEVEAIQKALEDIPKFLLSANDAAVVAVQSGYAWILTGEGTLLELCLADGAVTARAEGLTEIPAFALRESDGAAAMTFGGDVVLFLPGGEELQRLTMPDERPGSLCFRGEELLVVCDTGYMLRFDSAGQQLSRTGLTVSGSFGASLFSKYNDPMDIRWYFTEDGKVILYAFELANIIECEGWTTCGYVSKCECYVPGTDQFLTRGEYGLRSLRRYATEELIEAAEEQLGTFKLSQELREAYGIG